MDRKSDHLWCQLDKIVGGWRSIYQEGGGCEKCECEA